MQQRYLILGILVFITLAFGVLWLGGTFEKSQEPIDNTGESGINAEDTDKQKDTAQISNPPADFAEFRDNNPDFNPATRAAYKQRFDVLVERLKKDPSEVLSWLDLGILKHAFKDYKGAESAWLYSVEVDQRNTQAYANLAQLYWHQLPDYPKAEEMFKKAIANDTSNYAVRLYRDLSDLYRYDYKEKAHLADDILKEGLKSFSDHPDLLSYLAIYYYQMGDKKQAIEYFQLLLSIDPSNESARGYLEELKS